MQISESAFVKGRSGYENMLPSGPLKYFGWICTRICFSVVILKAHLYNAQLMGLRSKIVQSPPSFFGTKISGCRTRSVPHSAGPLLPRVFYKDYWELLVSAPAHCVPELSTWPRRWTGVVCAKTEVCSFDVWLEADDDLLCFGGCNRKWLIALESFCTSEKHSVIASMASPKREIKERWATPSCLRPSARRVSATDVGGEPPCSPYSIQSPGLFFSLWLLVQNPSPRIGP